MERLRHRHREELLPTPPPEVHPLPPAPPEPPPTPAPVQVIWGPMSQAMAVAGMTIAEVRALLRAPFNIPPRATILVNGRPAAPGHRLAAGEVLEFVRAAGEKGV